MGLRVQCKACGSEAGIPDDLLSTSVSCPACGATVSAPNSGAAEAEAPFCEWEDRSRGLFARFWTAWWRALFHPDDFFRRLPRDTEASTVFHFAFMASAQTWAPMLLLLIPVGVILWIVPINPDLDWLGPGIVAFAGGYTALLYPLTWLGVIATTAVFHVSARLCGGHGTWSDSHRIVCYAWGAHILGLVPQVGGLLNLAAHLVLYLYGFHHLHRVSMSRAVFMFLLPTIGLILIVLAFVAAMAFLIISP